MKDRINSHRDLIVYRKSFAAGERMFELSKRFPREEMHSLTDQVRRSARSVSANIAEAWRKRRYEKHFCSTLNVAEAEAAETQVWIEYAVAHGYIDAGTGNRANACYEEIIRLIVAMINSSEKWCVRKIIKEERERKKGGVKERGSGYKPAPLIDQTTLLNSPTPNSPTLKTGASDA